MIKQTSLGRFDAKCARLVRISQFGKVLSRVEDIA